MKQEDAEYVGSVTLMLLGEDLDPDQVTSDLRLVASRCWRKGEIFAGPDGTIQVFNSKREWGGWKMFIPSEHKEDAIETQLEFWVRLLLPRTVALKRFRQMGFSCVLDVFIATEETASLAIHWKLLNDMAELALDLRWSFFAHSEDSGPLGMKCELPFEEGGILSEM